MSEKRDPRIDPRPGDVLGRGKPTGARRVIYFPDRRGYGLVEWTDGVQEYHSTLRGWKRWAKNAEVIHAAE